MKNLLLKFLTAIQTACGAMSIMLEGIKYFVEHCPSLNKDIQVIMLRLAYQCVLQFMIAVVIHYM